MSRTLHARAASGLRWTFVDSLGEKALSFSTTMVLARLLDPADFGLYALLFVVLDTLGIFKNLGLDAAIIQRKDRVEDAADTAFLTLPFVGLTLFGLAVAAAPTVAGWLAHPEIVRPLRVLAVVLVIMSLGNVPSALLQKRMQFRLHTTANLIGMAVYAVLAIVLALLGFGVWSLIYAYIIDAIVTAALQWVFSAWRPRWRFDGALFRTMFHYSKYVLGAGLIGFLANNADKLIIGRFLGTTQLGYYTLACSLAYLATTQLTKRVYQVAFPAFAEVQDDPARLRAGFLKMLRFLCATALPICAFVGLLARPLVLTVYGAKWGAAAPVLMVLAVAGAFQVIRVGVNPILLACGRSNIGFLMNALQLLILIGVTPWAARQAGLVGASWVSAAAFAISGCLGAWVVVRHVQLSWAQVVAAVRPTAIALAAMAAATILLRLAGGWAHLHALAPVWKVLAGGGVVAVAYGLVLLRLDRTLVRELRAALAPGGR